ncbi:MAG: hypothetical protein SVY53_12170 [Chloroflexota bacterium]|nr:hypothetical protein [Chloroflexota bacterium]
MHSKWKSRKFWTAIVGEVAGIVTLIWGVNVSEQVTTIAGAVILIAATLGYLTAETSIDKERAKKQ